MQGSVKNSFKILLLLLLRTSIICLDMNYQITKDYLQYINAKTILFVLSENQNLNELIKKSANFQSDGFWISHWNTVNTHKIGNFNYDHFFVRWSHQICVVIDLGGNRTQEILHEISERKMFHFERSWLMFGTNAEHTFNVLSEENINVDAQIAIVTAIDKNEFQIDDVYNPSHIRHCNLRSDKIGSWNKKTGLQMVEVKTKIERRRDLGGVTFLSVIAIPKIPPNMTLMEHINSNENTHLDSSSKNNYRIYQLLMEMYNFKMQIHRSKIWGALQPNGTWIGALGLVNRSEVDICISGVRWENDRYGAFEQTTEGYYVRVLFLFRHPRSVDTMKIFLSPFDVMVWSLILFVGLVISVENHFIDLTRKCVEMSQVKISYIDNLFMVCGILFQQGYSETSKKLSSRVLITTILIFSLIIYQFYGSFIVGALLTEPPKTIKTVQQLYQSKLAVASDDIAYVQDIFKYAGEEWTSKLYNRVTAQPQPIVPLHLGLNMVKRGQFAINTDANYAYKLLERLLTDREACDLQEISYVPKIPTGSPLPNKSPLKEMIKIGIRKLYETGTLAHLWKIWIGHKSKCEHSVDVVAVDLMHFSSAFYALGFGMQFSIAFLLGELISKHSVRSLLMKLWSK